MLLLSVYRLTTKIAPLLLCFSGLFGIANLSWAANDDDDSDKTSSNTNDAEAAPTADAPSYYLPNIPKKRAQALIHHLELMERQDEIVQLSGLAEDYYGLFLAEATGNPQGGVLILHDNQQHGHWPDIVAPLREYLPQHGWSTLSIELPDTPARQRITRQDIASQPNASSSSTDTEENENAGGTEPITTNQKGEPLLTEEATDNDGPDLSGQPDEQEDNDALADDSLEPALPKLAKLPDLENKTTEALSPAEEMAIDPIEHYRKQNQQRIVAAMEYLRSKGQLNLVIIGYGIGAAWAIDYIDSQNGDTDAKVTGKNDNKGLTLVTIDAMPSRHSTLIMNQQLTKLKIPFLDLIQPNKAYAIKQGKNRLAIMKRNKNEEYQQIITSDMPSYHENENPTNRRIRGWLKSNAGGTLVKMRP